MVRSSASRRFHNSRCSSTNSLKSSRSARSRTAPKISCSRDGLIPHQPSPASGDQVERLLNHPRGIIGDFCHGIELLFVDDLGYSGASQGERHHQGSPLCAREQSLERFSFLEFGL